MEKQHNRSLTIDTFRGIGILLVVLGHTAGLPTSLHNYIYSFHMPAFFILSGYLFNPNKIDTNAFNFIKAKFYRLIVPAWVLGLACGVPFIAFLYFGMEGITGKIFLQKLIGTLTGYPKVELNFLCTPIWFLFAIFLTEAIAVAAHKISKSSAILILYIIGAVGIVLSNFVTYTPFNITIAITATFFYAIGMTARKYRSTFSARQSALITISCLVIAYLTNRYSPTPISMSENFIAEPAWIFANIAGALAGTFILYYISTIIQLKPLAWIGTKTLPILAFNYYANVASDRLLTHFGIESWQLTFLLQTVALISLVIALRITPKIDKLLNGQWSPTNISADVVRSASPS